MEIFPMTSVHFGADPLSFAVKPPCRLPSAQPSLCDFSPFLAASGPWPATAQGHLALAQKWLYHRRAPYLASCTYSSQLKGHLIKHRTSPNTRNFISLHAEIITGDARDAKAVCSFWPQTLKFSLPSSRVSGRVEPGLSGQCVTSRMEVLNPWPAWSLSWSRVSCELPKEEAIPINSLQSICERSLLTETFACLQLHQGFSTDSFQFYFIFSFGHCISTKSNEVPPVRVSCCMFSLSHKNQREFCTWIK